MRGITVDGLSFSYPGGGNVLDGLSFSIPAGQFVAVAGPTGCGKTTLLSCLNGIVPRMVRGSYSGSVKTAGLAAAETPAEKFLGRVGFVFQNPDAQIFALSVFDEVAFALRNMGFGEEETARRVGRALCMVGLSGFEGRDPSLLSHGQKQKVCIASALAPDPQIIVLDEPVSSLDHRGACEIYSILAGLSKRGRTIVVAEHDSERLFCADRVVVLDSGKIALDAPPLEAFSSPVFASLGLAVPCSVKIGKGLGRPAEALQKMVGQC